MELVWNPYPEKRDKIVLAARPADLALREKWSEYLDWMTQTVIAFQKAFRDRVRNLDLSGLPSDREPEEV